MYNFRSYLNEEFNSENKILNNKNNNQTQLNDNISSVNHKL